MNGYFIFIMIFLQFVTCNYSWVRNRSRAGNKRRACNFNLHQSRHCGQFFFQNFSKFNKRRAFNKDVGPGKKFTINKRRVYVYSKLESMLEYFTCQLFHKILILEKQRDKNMASYAYGRWTRYLCTYVVDAFLNNLLKKNKHSRKVSFSRASSMNFRKKLTIL